MRFDGREQFFCLLVVGLQPQEGLHILARARVIVQADKREAQEVERVAPILLLRRQKKVCREERPREPRGNQPPSHESTVLWNSRTPCCTSSTLGAWVKCMAYSKTTSSVGLSKRHAASYDACPSPDRPRC